MTRKGILASSIAALLLMTSGQVVFAGQYTIVDMAKGSAEAAGYAGTYGTIQFNDWGYTGPNNVGYNDFQVGGGFNPNDIGQIQHVVTKSPDWLTPDPGKSVSADLSPAPTPAFPNANMDGTVNFYKWAYTTPVNSTFSNMQIDRAGNYYIAKQDMAFGFYDGFSYRDTTGVNAPEEYDTQINFQPYAISDARGWCGSTLVSNPNGVEVMAGQVTFDFAFDAYFEDPNNPSAPGSYSSTQLVPAFVMRSYGDYYINLRTTTTNPDGTIVDGAKMIYEGHAVGNNTDPTTVVPGVGGTLDGTTSDGDPSYQNQVSFLGGGIVPNGVWTSADSYNSDGSRKMRTSCNQTTLECKQVWDVTIVADSSNGAVWHDNSFKGYAYLLRADGTRTLDFIAPSHSLYVQTVPVPAAVWLFGSGMLGLLGMARRRQSA
jgi:hypothetical protein